VTSVCQRSIPTRSNLSGGCGRCAASATGARPLGWASLSLLGLLLARRTSRRKRGAGARSER
jgi:MYXO-CTERM domain-containing protein